MSIKATVSQKDGRTYYFRDGKRISAVVALAQLGKKPAEGPVLPAKPEAARKKTKAAPKPEAARKKTKAAPKPKAARKKTKAAPQPKAAPTKPKASPKKPKAAAKKPKAAPTRKKAPAPKAAKKPSTRAEAPPKKTAKAGKPAPPKRAAKKFTGAPGPLSRARAQLSPATLNKLSPIVAQLKGPAKRLLKEIRHLPPERGRKVARYIDANLEKRLGCDLGRLAGDPFVMPCFSGLVAALEPFSAAELATLKKLIQARADPLGILVRIGGLHYANADVYRKLIGPRRAGE